MSARERFRGLGSASLLAIAIVAAGQLAGLRAGIRIARSHHHFSAGLRWTALDSVRGEIETRVLTWGLAALVAAGLWVALATWWNRRDPGAARASLSRRALVATLAVALLPSLLVRAAMGLVRASPERPWNVVWITIDTLRADHLGSYGYPRDTSPSIDSLARGGIRFDQAIVQWPKTTPSIASMLSGTYPHSNGVTRFTPLVVPDRVVSIAEILRDRGFATAAVSTHPALSPSYNVDHGFESFVETWGVYRGKSARAAKRAIRFLGERTAERPCFRWVHFMDPHARYEPPAPFHSMFVGDAHFDPSRKVRLNEGVEDDIGGVPGRSHLADHDSFAYYVAQYDAEIRYVDSQVARVLAALDERGLAERTIVVLTADHGESLGDHEYYFEHGRLPYDDCLRVPLVVRFPAALGAAGTVVKQPVELVGVTPTVLEVLGIPAPKSVQGSSLMPWIRGRTEGGSAFAGAGYRQHYQRVLRDGRWKLVYVPADLDRRIMRGAPYELYDVTADPGETRNLVDAEPDVAARLRADLERRMARYDRAAASLTRTVEPADARALEELRSLGYLQ
ncbi:MAG: sulfatase family protein [Candidatus Binatia bacterium]